MKKRRVLALLLALSLAVSTNGMTVFATEAGELTAPVVSPVEETTEDVQDEAEDDADDEQDIDSEETDENKESGGDSTEDQTGTDDDGSNAGEDSDVDGEEVSDEQNPDVEDEADEIVSENELPDEEEPEEEESEELPEVIKHEVRMMTFTDDTGLKITYDATEAEENGEKVAIADGVLTKVTNGLEGVIDLRDKEFTEIAAGAFRSQTKITYIMLPKSVTTIGAGAFEDCSALKGISIPSRLTAVQDDTFKGCVALTQLALPNSVETIGAGAFQGDSRLFMVHMVGADYSKLTSIGDSAFEGCTSLELFCSDATYNLPKSLKSIGERAFFGCRSISSIIMGDEIETLGKAVYQNCSGIKEILISSKVAVIPENAFANCTALADIKFSSVNKIKTTISGYAFSKCTRLGNVELTNKIELVRAYAFEGCTSLKRVVVKDDWTVLEANALPSSNADLCLIVGKESEARKYSSGGVRIIYSDDPNFAAGYYTYTAQLSGEGTNTNQISVKVTNEKSVSGQDINTIKNGNVYGVKDGTTCYVVINLGTLGSTVRVVSGSVKCNGEPIKSKDGFYTFTMPVGGAAIEVEFENKPSVETYITGDKDSIVGRLSADVNYDFQKNTGYLKVGQSTKFYLTNNYSGTEERIPVSKVKYKQSAYSASGVVSIAADGTVKALKKGTAMVEGTVKTKIGTLEESVTVSLSIVVEDTGIDHISMLLSAYDEDRLEARKDEKGGFIGVEVPTTKLADQKACTFQLTAVAFASEENDEPMEVPFTWATSDTKVAKLAKTSTTAATSVNTITVPTNNAGGGEATITVSAKDANGKKVSQKFIVTVMNYDPRLTVSKITINPKQVDGATKIGIISAYGKQIDTTKAIKVCDAKTGSEISGFHFTFDSKSDSVYTYEVTAIPGMKQITYNTKIKVELNDIAGTSEVPLTIVVKESLPNPTVSFDKKAPKINLFYANDGTVIQPIVSKLGDAVVSGYSLEPLTKEGDKGYKEEDALFLENFQIDPVTGAITQNAPKLAVYTSNKKPVISGYLVLKFKDYRADATKRYKITIPTQTTTPTYALDRTTDTFYQFFTTDQIIYLQLLDKKTKKPIEWDDSWDGTNVLTAETNSTCDAEPEIVGVDGKIDGVDKKVVNIKVTFTQGMRAGKLNMKLVNKKWAEGKSAKFTYTIKLDKNFRKLSLQKSTITLNANYPERAEKFKLVSNQRDTVFVADEVQKFIGQTNTNNLAQYGWLTVNCRGGEGEAAFNVGADEESRNRFSNEIKAGNYKYVYTYYDEITGKNKTVTLTIKVVKTEPTVTLKGSNVFNLQAFTTEGGVRKYVETAEMAVTVKNLPDNPKYIETPSTPDVSEGSGDEGGTTTPEGSGDSDNIGESGQGTTKPGGSDIGETEGIQTSRETAQLQNPEYYSFNDVKSFDSIEFTTKGFTDKDVNEYFDFKWIDGEKSTEGTIEISLKKDLPVKTYTLKMMPYYSNSTNETHPKKAVSFNVKICSNDITVKLTAKGKLNLLDRNSEHTEKNGIHYTPVFSNLKDTLDRVVLLDASDGRPSITQEDKISDLFEAWISPDEKSFYVVPKDDAVLNNNQNYELRVWIKTKDYTFLSNEGGIYPASTIKVKTAQILPKVKTDKSTVDLYLSSKDYSASFLVQKSDEKAIGKITDIAFGEKDDKANESFEIVGTKQEDGSLLVYLKLKNGVSYRCNSTNKIKMYIKFEGQGANTEGTAITMNVKINK